MLGSDDSIKDVIKLGSDVSTESGIKHGIKLGSNDSNAQLQ